MGPRSHWETSVSNYIPIILLMPLVVLHPLEYILNSQCSNWSLTKEPDFTSISLFYKNSNNYGFES